MKQHRIWITWETQRRSVELAKRLGCRLFIRERKGVLDYPKAVLKTLWLLRGEKPSVLFVQNPSMILATTACFYGMLTRVPVVVDRHSTFVFSGKHAYTPRLILFNILHHITVKLADLTIVTNKYLAEIVMNMGGSPFVLPDKIPEFKSSRKMQLKGRHNIIFISSFGEDEPIGAVLDAMKWRGLRDVCLYITGNYNKLDRTLIESSPPNTVFTGFLKEQEFINMLFSADAVMVLTTADHCMLCGCYEAVAACKPLITSDKVVLREYFTEAVFVNNTASGIYEGINRALNNIDACRERMELLHTRLVDKWGERYTELETRLAEFS